MQQSFDYSQSRLWAVVRVDVRKRPLTLPKTLFVSRHKLKEFTMGEKKERNFLEAFLEGGEAALDLLTDNEAVKAVPVVGTAIKVLKGFDDVRDRALAAKLEKFVQDPSLQSDGARDKLRNGISTDAQEAIKVGETLFLVLDKMTDLDKPSLLARVFRAYLDGLITSVDLRRLAHAIDGAFTDDLVSLESWQESAHVSYGAEWKQPLVGVGLTRTVTGQVWDNATEVHYELTDLGRKLYQTLWHAE